MAANKKVRGTAHVEQSKSAGTVRNSRTGQLPTMARAPRTLLTKADIRESLRAGSARADAILKNRAKTLRGRSRTFSFGSLGLLIFEGDSWFNYIGTDIHQELGDMGYVVQSNAWPGKRIQEMARQPEALQRLIERQTAVPKAVLLSGGGNDIVYNDNGEFLRLLNPASSPNPGWNWDEVAQRIDVDLQRLYLELLATVTQFCVKKWQLKVPILIHGYANPVPDGRPAYIKGPWLSTVFKPRGYVDATGEVDLGVCTPLMAQLIARFNTMLQGLPSAAPNLGHVTYVDVRPALRNDANYQDDWENELHPMPDGFSAVTKRIAVKLNSVGNPISSVLFAGGDAANSRRSQSLRSAAVRKKSAPIHNSGKK
jgi:hypothetical protein